MFQMKEWGKNPVKELSNGHKDTYQTQEKYEWTKWEV